jgi:uncharacterized protein (TIGR00369 family)
MADGAWPLVEMAGQTRARRRSPRARGKGRVGGRLGEIQAALAAGWTAPVARHIGFRVAKVEPGLCRVEFEAERRHANPMGTLHGGVLCDIADAAMGMAYASELGSNESFTTIELKINFLRPFWVGRLVAEGTVLRKGRTFGLLQCRVVDDPGHLVAYATATCMTLPAEPGGTMVRPGDSRGASSKHPAKRPARRTGSTRRG